jgi:two-component system chemotaxis response regulator CheY
MREVKVVMTTVLDDMGNVNRAFYQGGATAYLVKPIMRKNVVEELRKLGIG